MRTRLFVAAFLAAGLMSPASAQSVRAGIQAWQRADYEAAVRIWRPLAEKGDADASFNLGQAYRLGRGVPVSLAAAQTWLERAARKGHVDAQTTLGLLLFQNGNQTGGLRWLKQAAEKADPRALLIYGTALFNGDGVPRDPVLGYAYVSRAAAQGLAPAKETLAQLDSILPVEERKKGVAIAIADARQRPASPSKTGKRPAKPANVPKTSPAPAPAREAAAAGKAQPPATAGGSWRIQLGAFSHRGSAEALYRKLTGKSAISGRQAYYVPAGAVTRLQVGPFATRAAAQAACAGLKPQPCFPVAGK